MNFGQVLRCRRDLLHNFSNVIQVELALKRFCDCGFQLFEHDIDSLGLLFSLSDEQIDVVDGLLEQKDDFLTETGRSGCHGLKSTVHGFE